MKLSKRLKAIFDLVPPGVAADVGADHGYLIISLIQEGKIKHGIAIENKSGPYNRLLENVKKHHLDDEIDVLLSDGIKDIPSNVNTVILAGMGGTTIINILKNNKDKLKYVDYLIIDAHSCIPKLREEISKMGYAIADEKIVEEDNVYYEIIKFIKADSAIYTNNDFEFGPILRQQKSALFKEKYKNRLKEIDRLLNENLPSTKQNELVEEAKNIRGIL